MNEETMVERLLKGVAAGFIGTTALMAARMASQKWLPQAAPPLRQDPGLFMVKQVESTLPAETAEQIPDVVESAAGQTLALGYGLTSGAAYAAFRHEGGPPLTDGVLFGLGVWAVGYLGWLPALDIMPPVHKQRS